MVVLLYALDAFYSACVVVLWAVVDRLLGMHVAACLLLTDDRIAMLCMPCNAEARLGFCSVYFSWAQTSSQVHPMGVSL